MKSRASLILALLVPILLFAQSDRGTLPGTVADPSGALVPEPPCP